MTLLTREEYGAIAAGLDYPSGAFIDGGFRPAISGETFATINPATGETLAHVAACGAQDVDFAVEKAREAFEDGRWSRLHPSERKDVLIRLAKLMMRNARELAVMESLDSGKTIYDCETVDVPETIHCLKWHAEAIDKIYDQVAPASDDHIAMILREPVGVVGLVLPWNFPLLMLAWKIAPALAAGCSVVVKPAEETSLTALRVAELAMEAGVPRGVLNVVPGGGAAVGDPLDPQTRLGALVSPAHFDKVAGYLAQAEDVLIGGKAENGFVAATVVAVADNAHPLAREEIFGPVLSVIEMAGFDEAIAMANDTDYGLCASIFTANVKRAIRGARALRAGTVTVNSFGEGDITTPFGGYGQSGFGGRDNGVHAHDQYTRLKTLWIDLADDDDEAIA